MTKLKVATGYLWAVISIIILISMIGLSQMPLEKLNQAFGIKVSARVTGGEVATTIQHDGYKTLIYRTVFDGVINDRNNGFVQIEWEPDGGEVPAIISEQVDFNNDGTSDFAVRYDTSNIKASINKYNPKVTGIGDIYEFKGIYGLRVTIKK